jgi:hypothetical protein
VLADQAQAEEATPVSADQGDGVEAVLLDDRPGPVDVGLVGVVVAVGGLVAAPEADQVHRQRPQVGGEDGDHFAIQARPGRLTMQQQHDLAVTRSFVEVVDPPAAAVPSVHLDVVGLEEVVDQVDETVVGRSQDFQRSAPQMRERAGRM